jgi:hypothetical protein
VVSVQLQSSNSGISSVVAVPWSSTTLLLVVEYPGGPGTQAFLVWRNAASGGPSDCGAGLQTYNFGSCTVLYSLPGCTGQVYLPVACAPPLGLACYFNGNMAAAVAAPSGTSVAYWSSRPGAGACVTETAQRTTTDSPEMVTVGPYSNLVGPLRLVPSL